MAGQRNEAASPSHVNTSIPVAPPLAQSSSVDQLNAYVKRQAVRGMEKVEEEGEHLLDLLRDKQHGASSHVQMDSMNYDNVLDYMHANEFASESATQRWTLIGLKSLITVLIAFVTAMMMYGVSVIVRWASEKRIDSTVSLIEEGYSAAAYFSFTIISLVITGVASLICTVFAPHARGGGVPYLFAYLNGTNVSHFFSFRTVASKVVALAFTIAGGLTLGMEGPFVYIGGGTALLICQAWELLPGVQQQGKYTRVLRSISEERIFMACGLAAGLTVAFNAPIAGILFAMEGATSFLTVSAVLRIFACSMFAMFFKDIAFNNWSSHIKITNLITIVANDVDYAWLVPEVLAFTLLAVIGGLMGVVAVRLNVAITKWRHHYMEDRIKANMSEVALITGVTASIMFVIPLLFGCKVMPTYCADSGETRCQQLFCPLGTYSEIGSIVYASSEILSRNLLDRTIPIEFEFDIFPLLVYMIFYLFLVAWVYGAYVPGGLFVPSIVIGACYGRVTGIILNGAVSTSINSGVYALLGAAGMLGGFTRLGLPVVVMLVEMTGDATYLLPIMYIATLAKLMADQIEPPLYPQHMAIEKIAQIGDKIPLSIAAMKAEDIMDRVFFSLPVICKVGSILDILDLSTGQQFPVVDEDGRFEGFIHKLQLKYCIGIATHYGTKEDAAARGREGRTPTSRSRMSSAEDRDGNSLNQTGSADQAHLNETQANNRESMLRAEGALGVDWRNSAALEEMGGNGASYNETLMNRFVNLRPFTDTGVISVQETTSNKRVHAIFRKIGPTHLPVIDTKHKLKGIITRRCLLNPPNPSQPRFEEPVDEPIPTGSATIIVHPADSDLAVTGSTSVLDDQELISATELQERRKHLRSMSVAERIQIHTADLR